MLGFCGTLRRLAGPPEKTTNSMVKKSNVRTARKKAPRSQRARVVQARAPRAQAMAPPGRLDQSATEYMRLIKDPCNAKLTNTIWPGSSGSFVGRFESDFILWNQATAVGGFLVYTPGTNSIVANSTLLTSDTLPSVVGYDGVNIPSAGFLMSGTSVGSFRAVAACVQVMFPGTELNRSGIVSGGVTRFDPFVSNLPLVDGGSAITTTASQMRSLCQHTERTPQEMMEIIWFPGPNDSDTFKPQTATTGITAANVGRNSIVISASGFPVSTGIRVRIVLVAEWNPAQSGASNGLVSTVEMPRSYNTVNDVLMALPQGNGTSWFINAYRKAQPYLRAAGGVIQYAAKTLGPAMLAL